MTIPPAGPPAWALGDVVRRLQAAPEPGARRHAHGRAALPSRAALVAIVQELRAVLFPAHFGPPNLTPDGAFYFVGHTLDGALLALHDQLRRAFLYACEHGEDCSGCEPRAAVVAGALAERLPDVRALLETDIQAAFEGDPAATSIDEAIVCYPGVTAMTHHRLAHELYRLGAPLIPRIVSEIAHAETGIDIHPGAAIGPSFFIDHGTGVVIGETTTIGARVRLYQGVTLGARSFPLDEQGRPIKGIPRHPIVEDEVEIYAGATILGRVTIGRGSKIGGNVWLTRSVPAESRVYQAQARSEVFDAGGGI